MSDGLLYLLVFAVLALLGLYIYFIPYLVARRRWHRNRSAIGAFNFFLGWSFFGWVAALVWAYSDNVEGSPR